MTPSQRELAEYVARWAGWTCISEPDDKWKSITGQIRVGVGWTLSSAGMAWEAQEELIEMIDYECAAKEVASIMRRLGCTRIEATHRALRAARGGE